MFTFTGSPYLFGLTLQDPDYGIPTKNIWIVSFSHFARDRPPSTLFRGLRNPKSFPLGMEFRTSKRSDPFE